MRESKTPKLKRGFSSSSMDFKCYLTMVLLPEQESNLSLPINQKFPNCIFKVFDFNDSTFSFLALASLDCLWLCGEFTGNVILTDAWMPSQQAEKTSG